MNSLEKKLFILDSGLLSRLQETKVEVKSLLNTYIKNFPTYTDHSILHTELVFDIASEILSDAEIEKLNSDEIYVLSMACYLHDVGMCIPEDEIRKIAESKELLAFKESHPNITLEEHIREIHHQLSNNFILKEWELLKIPSKKYAKAIGLVAEGHRKVDLGNFEIYNPNYFAKSGKEFVCLPYLACVLRIADELDVTNSRTPRILTKYYMPNNEVSKREWEKHIATSQRNYLYNKVIFEVACSDQNIYAALQEQFEKIQTVINYCQKIVRSIPNRLEKQYELGLTLVEVDYEYLGFDPKGIRFSFDIQNVVTAFIGEDLYKNKMTSLREAIQNSIDTCRYKSKVLKENSYKPSIKIYIDDNWLKIDDNGAGMDEFIIENFFGRLASSFYEQEKIKTQFEAIGQFGVGVFSYFLLCEYIDIETKTSIGSTLKFRFDKDPKSYFHFYDKTDRTTAGTGITLYLKEKLKGSLPFKNIENYMRQIFNHIEIPIELIGLDNQSIIESKPFKIDSLKEIKNCLKMQHRKISEQLETKSFSICDDELEGYCAIIISKNPLETFAIDTSYFDEEQFANIDSRQSISKVSISQKGVFVNYYGTPFVNYILGDINLKKKVKINIDRNQFTDQNEISEILCRFEFYILKELFEAIKIKKFSVEEKLKISIDFLSNYTNYFTIDILKNMNYVDLLKKSLFVIVYFNNTRNIITLQDLYDNYPEYLLISESENAEKIYDQLKKPLLLAKGHRYTGCYGILRSILINAMKYSSSIIIDKNKSYELLQSSKNDQNFIDQVKIIKGISDDFYLEILKSNSNKILLNIWLNKSEFSTEYYDDSFIFNLSHKFIQFIIANHEEIILNPEYKKIIRAAFGYILELQTITSEIDIASLKKLNKILEPLNRISPFPKFSMKDFYQKNQSKNTQHII